MRLGIASSLNHTSPEHWARQLSELGCKSAVFPLNCNSDKALIKEYAQAAKENDIVIAEVGIWNNMLDKDSEQRKKNIDYNIRQLILADEIGAVCAVNIAGTPYAERWDGPHKLNFSEEIFELTVNTVKEILTQANPQKTHFSIESMPWMIPSGPDEYLRLLNAVDHKKFTAHLDIVNMITSPKRYFFNDEFLRECFETLKGRICSCHLKDIKLLDGFTFQLKECACGEGELDIELFAKLCDEQNPDMPLLIEHLTTDEEYKESLLYVQKRLGIK